MFTAPGLLRYVAATVCGAGSLTVKRTRESARDDGKTVQRCVRLKTGIQTVMPVKKDVRTQYTTPNYFISYKLASQETFVLSCQTAVFQKSHTQEKRS